MNSNGRKKLRGARAKVMTLPVDVSRAWAVKCKSIFAVGIFVRSHESLEATSYMRRTLIKLRRRQMAKLLDGKRIAILATDDVEQSELAKAKVSEKKEQSSRPRQQQNRQPGLESEMQPRPRAQDGGRHCSQKLEGKIALITGGDSGIGRAVAVAFAQEGADVAIVYLNEHEDAKETERLVANEHHRCLTVAGDVGDEQFCRDAVEKTVREFGRLDILINNAAEQHPQKKIEEISAAQLERTFRTNIFSFFYMTKAALPHLPEGGSIINTSSVTAYRGSPDLLDYSATKGAIVAFTRSLAKALAERSIRVNAVAPGPIWTPLIPSTFPPEKVERFGKETTLGRPGEPVEVAPSYVFLASSDGSYFTGQVLHPNGGEVVNA
jgi:NAD(P)-dependent dehydrogenase (short-subunit alcohol dehydrogenase family)